MKTSTSSRVSARSKIIERPGFGGAQPGSGRPAKDGNKTSFNVAPDVTDLLAQLKKLGFDKTKSVESGVRMFAKSKGLEVKEID